MIATTNLIDSNHRFPDVNVWMDAVRRWGIGEGFRICFNTYHFTKTHPHPTLERAVQRGYAYCSFKTPETKSNTSIKTTCTWRVEFTFDRQSVDYYVRQNCCSKHNHVVQNPHYSAGGLQEISLESYLSAEECSKIASFARYNIELFKVLDVQLSKCFRMMNSLTGKRNHGRDISWKNLQFQASLSNSKKSQNCFLWQRS